MRAAGALGPRDYLGVVAFDEAARWAVEVSPLVDPIALERAIGGLPAEGRPTCGPGWRRRTRPCDGVEARFKHVILLTDGWVREGELTPLAAEKREQGITLSVVAAGEGSARYLEELAESGGGRYYPAVDILRVPDFFLKETVQAVGRYIVEEPFYPLPAMPSPILRGIDVATTPPAAGLQRHHAQRHGARGAGHAARGPAAGDLAVRPGARGGLDLGPQAALGGRVGGLGRVCALCRPVGRLDAARAAGGGAGGAGHAVEEDAGSRDLCPGDRPGRAPAQFPGRDRRPDRARPVGAGGRAGAGGRGPVRGARGPGRSGHLSGAPQRARMGRRALGQQTLGLVVPYSPEYAPQPATRSTAPCWTRWPGAPAGASCSNRWPPLPTTCPAPTARARCGAACCWPPRCSFRWTWPCAA